MVCSNRNSDIMEENNGWSFGTRHIQVLLFIISMYSVMCIGVCTNIAILAMTDKNDTNNNTIFDWNKQTIGYIASSQYWGDIIVQLGIGPILHKFGGKLFVTISLGGTAIIQLLIPYLAELADWKGMCFGGLLMGILGGLYFPALQTLLGKWAPVDERTRMGMFSYTGLNLAYITSFPFSAYISSSSYGWKGVYYFYGCQNLLCCLLWIFLAANSPSEHKNISKEEREMILTSLEQSENETSKKIPWMAIFTSKPYWAVLLVQAGALWSFFVISYEMPSYFKNGVGTELQESGLFSSFGYILAILTGVIGSMSFDYLLIKKYFSLTQLRKIYNTIGTCGPAICLVIVSYIPIQYVKTIISLTTLIVGLDSINGCGYMMSFVDLSPHYCGMLYSISIVFSDIICLLAPVFDGYILDDITDITKWRKVLLMASATYFFGNLIFLIFGTAEKQPWDNDKEKKIEDKDEVNGASEKMIVDSVT